MRLIAPVVLCVLLSVPEGGARSVFSSDFVDELRSADQVQVVFLMANQAAPTDQDSPQRFDKYWVEGTGPVLTREQQARLVDLITDPSGYLPPPRSRLEQKGCVPEPRLGFSFMTGPSVTSEVAISLSCHQLFARSCVAWARAGGDFDPMASAIEGFLREVVPDLSGNR